MTSLLHLYPGDNAAILIGTVLAQVAGLVLLALVVSRTLACRDPAARYGVWLCALVCVPLGAMAVCGFQQTGFAVVRLPWLPPAVEEGNAADAATETAKSLPTAIALGGDSSADDELAAPPFPAAPPPSGPPWFTADRLRALGGGLAAAWLAGVAVLLLRLLWGWHLLVILRRHLQPVAPRELAAVAADVCRTLAIPSLPEVMTSRRVGGPISLGVFRPLVVLPAGLIETLNARQLRDVLVHECAHFLKRDHAVAWLQRVVQIVLWPHPLVYMLNRELGRAREEVCDNYVLRGGDVPYYARTLLAISQRSRPGRPAISAIGMLQPRRRLERRVAGLLDARRKLVTRIHRGTLAAAAAGLLAAAALIAGTRLVPAPAIEPQAPDDAIAARPDTTADAAPEARDIAGEAVTAFAPASAAIREPAVAEMVSAVDAGLPAVDPIVATRPLGTVPPLELARGEAGPSPLAVDPGPARQPAQPDQPIVAASASSGEFVAALGRAAVRLPAMLPADSLAGGTPARGTEAASTVLEPAPAPTAAELLTRLQPMVQVELDRMGYLVTLRLAGDVESSVAVDPGQTGRIHVEEGLHQRLTFEVTIEPDELPEQVTASYRLSLQTAAEDFYEWHGEQVALRLGAWAPLGSYKVEPLSKPAAKTSHGQATRAAAVKRAAVNRQWNTADFARLLEGRLWDLDNTPLAEMFRAVVATVYRPASAASEPAPRGSRRGGSR